MSSLLTPSIRTPSQQPQDLKMASPSYFGLAVDSSTGPVTSSGSRIIRKSYSPSRSNVRSSAMSPPQTLPFHSTTADYDAFKREVERKQFSFNETGNKESRQDDHDRTRQSRPVSPKTKPVNVARHKANSISIADLHPVSRSPKRLLSADSETVFDRPRRDSPASFSLTGTSRSGSPPPKEEQKMPRLSGQLSLTSEMTASEKASLAMFSRRAETLPSNFVPDDPSMITPEHVVNILTSHPEEVLILDLRVVTQYSRSHITGALNLCVPTTLLKRQSYDVQKLADTFKDPSQRSKFELWRGCKCIIVYDTNTSQMKEATNCLNVLKKFASQEWHGQGHIIKGGFFEFSRKFPQHVEQGEAGNRTASVPNLGLDTENCKDIAPVIGGCPMPASKSAVNPFFGNIRQNMDLIGGVGQMKVNLPEFATKQQREQLPRWLKRASAEKDDGKTVSDKFLHIEKREQKRMQDALSDSVVYGTPSLSSPEKVQIAGIEKGAKNRYNNIWPFEHSRVKLEGVPNQGCDYVNANYVHTSLSKKNYIATQGPIPATFSDFWNMVWQRDVRVIVMLTAEKEGGQVKAHNYWDQRRYGSFKLNFVSERRASLEPHKIKEQRPSMSRRHTSHTSSASHKSKDTAAPDHPYVIIRKFTLAHDAEPFERMREVTQLQYSSWPDFGAPAHPAHLLGLVEQCNNVIRSTAGGTTNSLERPVLVHCSAGCGRTGTFCTVDSVLDMLAQQSRLAPRSRMTTPMDLEVPETNPYFGGPKSPKPVTDSSWLGRDDIDLVEQTVEEFRLQRLSMVQSLRQFVLCYETVLEWIMTQA